MNGIQNRSNVSSQVTQQVARGDKRPGPKPLQQMAFLQVARSGRLLDKVPEFVIIDNILSRLDIREIDNLAEAAEVSEHFNEHVDSANQIAKKKLEKFGIKPEIEKMIKDSKITGIKMPAGSFENDLSEYIALTVFKDALSNWIDVLNDNKITSINGQNGIAQALIGARADVNALDNYLHDYRVLTAFKDDLPNAIDVLKNNNITDINARNNYGATPLHDAANKCNTKLSKALIAAGANVNAKQFYGETPLMLAAARGQADIAKALIDAKADVNAKDKRGWTPLRWAEINGRTEVVKILEDAQITK